MILVNHCVFVIKSNLINRYTEQKTNINKYKITN